MACDGCGRCCEELTWPFGGDSEWIERFTAFVEFTRPTTLRGVPGGVRLSLPCKYLDSGRRCAIYERRPEICRRFLCQKAGGTPPSPMKGKIVKLTVLERLTLLKALPPEGNFLTLKIVRQLREALSFSEEEVASLQLTTEGDQVRWNLAADGDGKEIPIGEKATDLIVESLKKLDQQGKLTEQHLSVYEKFIPS